MRLRTLPRWLIVAVMLTLPRATFAQEATLSGTVTDDRGTALSGAVVSALGATMTLTVSDLRGYFSLDSLPMGEYVVQAHLDGFAGSTRERIRVGAASASAHKFQLRKLDAVPVGTTGREPVAARPIMAAGFELPASTLSVP